MEIGKKAHVFNLQSAQVSEPFFGMNVNCPQLQEKIIEAIDECKNGGYGPSREFSLVRTKLEEALLWLKAAERGEMTS